MVGQRKDVAARHVQKQGKVKTDAVTKPARTIRSKGATVTFNVIVPENTTDSQRAVFLSGSFHQFSPNLPDWDPRGLPMRKLDDRNWTITLMSQVTSADTMVIDYKYTLGDWDHIEKDSNNTDIPNRRTVLEIPFAELLAVDDVVENWGSG